MKKNVLFSVIIISLIGLCPLLQHAEAGEVVTLTMGSWRPMDAPQMNVILDRFHERFPEIRVIYRPTNPSEYDMVLESQLKGGSGPDLFYLRSFSVARKLYEKGYCAPLGHLSGLMTHFSDQMREPWASEDHVPIGIPFIATSHGIYYNKTLFKRIGIEIPETWEDLITISKKIKSEGVIPFANAAGDKWTVNEIVFMNLLPNFIGGREGRKAYLSGERCFNDPSMEAAFKALKNLSPFFPKNHALLMYADSLQLFVQGRAAMWMGGSWDIPFFEAEKPEFEWAVFAVPPPKGHSPYITFHLDAGMGLNAHSHHKKEAEQFLEWMTTEEFASLLGNTLPGFFPMRNNPPELKNAHANDFLRLNKGRGTDIRFAWEKIRDGSPDAYTLLQEASVGVLLGDLSPKEAADSIQNGLSKWFEPAKKCKTP